MTIKYQQHKLRKGGVRVLMKSDGSLAWVLSLGIPNVKKM